MLAIYLAAIASFGAVGLLRDPVGGRFNEQLPLALFSASAMRVTTYSGIEPLICPANSMKRASKPLSLAFHDR